MDTETRKRTAKRLLVNYFRAVWSATGVKWDGDNQAEVEGIIDEIFDEIAEHAQPAHKGRLFKCEMDDRAAGPDWGAT